MSIWKLNETHEAEFDFVHTTDYMERDFIAETALKAMREDIAKNGALEPSAYSHQTDHCAADDRAIDVALVGEAAINDKCWIYLFPIRELNPTPEARR